MWDSHASRGIPMGMGTKLLKLMEIGREWQWLRLEWERLLLMCSYVVIIFLPKAVLDLVDI